ncbi:hypothetical protein BGZ83_011119 [Gryganskiella cystojenkinii]|nr:hypothetical protein BGZ83_011119 [Gryganskiella cystojenkinii]
MMLRYIGNVVTNTTATRALGRVQGLKVERPSPESYPSHANQSLNLGALGLVFTTPTAYEPITASTGVNVNYSAPDGVNFNIQFQLSRDGVTIANLNSSYSPLTSDIASGTLTFNLLATPHFWFPKRLTRSSKSLAAT